MKIIGLSGGIASGKNFIADLFAANGCAIFDADSEVHNLLVFDEVVIEKVKNNFPQSFIDHKIDRKTLGKIVFNDAKKLKILEEIIHPKVRENYREFIANCEREEVQFAVLNIPLLLESDVYRYDFLVAIIAEYELRKKRFIAREEEKNPQANLEKLSAKFDQITQQQITDEKRVKNADFVIKNNLTKDELMNKVQDILVAVRY